MPWPPASLVLAAAAATAACSSPPELTFRAYGTFVPFDPFNAIARLDVDETSLTSVDRAPNDALRTRFATLTPTGVDALEAAVSDVADAWDPTLDCPDCEVYVGFAFEDSTGEIVTTYHRGDDVPSPYRRLDAFATGVLDTLAGCETNSYYTLTTDSCPEPGRGASP